MLWLCLRPFTRISGGTIWHEDFNFQMTLKDSWVQSWCLLTGALFLWGFVISGAKIKVKTKYCSQMLFYHHSLKALRLML